MPLRNSYDIGSIYTYYYKDIYRYIYLMMQSKEATEDIVQNTFLKVMKGIGAFRGESSLKTWLMTIARNEALTYLKKEKLHSSLEELLEISLDYRGKQEDDKEMTEYILQYIQYLEEPKKSLMVFRLLDELSFVEIGQILGKSDTWCRVTFMRIKSNLLKEWEERIWKR